jgi:hypothetical protein
MIKPVLIVMDYAFFKGKPVNDDELLNLKKAFIQA